MTEAYKGYLLATNPFNGMIYVKKDGYTITTTETIRDAREAVDGLVRG